MAKQRENSGVKPSGRRRPGPQGGTLQDFGPGQSGNPAGRPKGSELRKLLIEALEQPAPGRAKNKTRGEQLLDDLMRLAKKQVTAQKVLWAYTEGLPTQRVELFGSMSQGPPVDLSKATTEELKEMDRLMTQIRKRQGDAVDG